MLILVLWIACGLVTAGFMNANIRGSYPTLNSAAQRREDFAFAIGWSLFSGPFGLILSPFLTGFYFYGWSYKSTPIEPQP